MKFLLPVLFLLVLTACQSTEPVTIDDQQSSAVMQHSDSGDISVNFPLTVLPATVDANAPQYQTAKMPADIWGDKEETVSFELQKPYTLDRTSWNNAITIFYDLEIKNAGVRHALYTHAEQYVISPDNNFLALKNFVQQEGATHRKYVRIISIASKKAVALPDIGCTDDIQQWSSNRLITSSSMHTDDAGGQYAQSVQICVWNTEGALLGRVEGRNFATATTERIINQMGMIPNEPNTLYALGVFNGGSPDERCQLAAVDLNNPSRRALLDFDPNARHYNCVFTQEDEAFELDLNSFTLDSPRFRFRVGKHKTGDVPDMFYGPWTEVK
jgi:hypothetical protein